jgi:hypothetical protein
MIIGKRKKSNSSNRTQNFFGFRGDSSTKDATRYSNLRFMTRSSNRVFLKTRESIKVSLKGKIS